MRSVFFAAVFGICAVQAALAVPVSINSGNPAFPFPQFLPYTHPNGDTLHNLANRNPAGVTHAEMEKSIRDAYAIMMNRAEYHGTVALGGTRYVRFISEPYCSEGYGYAMLAAAMMADKATFDGLWLYVHDNAMNKVVRYIDGKNNSPGYEYSTLPDWLNVAGSATSAADGDFDIALALMIAHKQWGDLMGIKDSRNRDISYKADFIEFLKGLSDTLTFAQSGNDRTLLSGDIGLDGYFKGGDYPGELSGWATTENLATIGINGRSVEQPGPNRHHVDYVAPSYFRQFADYLTQENASAYRWNINQFKRAEASSDWLVGKLIRQDEKNIPIAGWVEVKNGSDTMPVFTSFSDGEDFRFAWRTVLNYVWHGSPAYTWDPIRHTVTPGKPNEFEKDAGERFAKFIWDRRQAPWNKDCEALIKPVGGNWWGPSMLRYWYSPQGEQLAMWWINYAQGTGSPSAVTVQDTDLMAEMYRQLELEWDVATPGDRYLTSTPKYFHGFFRLLGMNVLTGNHHAPLNMKRGANMKVYVDVDKTYAFENDTITYTIDYRNYGAEDAQGVVIINRLHNDMKYVSSTGGGALTGNSVRWNVGTVPGFKTSTGVNPTKGSVSFKVVIPNASLKRYENSAQIACANGSGWTSNEYPNKISSVMKRNGVDIAKRALQVRHSVFRDTVNPGMNATYTIEFENSAEAGWLNGGRPGVNFTYGHEGTTDEDNQHTFLIRIFNDAHEAYIDYGNYRLSYFLFDNYYKGLVSEGAENGWDYAMINNIPDETEKAKARLNHEFVTEGQDTITKGKWNQRLILQVADPEDPSRSDTNWGTMAAPSQFLLNYDGLANRVHRGISTPFISVYRMFAKYSKRGWESDWSYNGAQVKVNTSSWEPIENWGYPVSPDFTESYDPDYAGKKVTSRHRKHCAPVTTTVENILIEEWDGYTWRRVFGNGPIPGRDVNNVVIRDTIPAGVTFQNFIEPFPFGKPPTRNGNVITWEIDKLQVGQSGKIQYAVTADTPPGGADARITSRAWASADKESPISGTAVLVVTSGSLPPLPPPPTSMSKKADKGTYLPGDTIKYTIAYKQTHGYPAVSTSASQWNGTTSGIRNDTINISGNVNTRFTPSFGTNGTLTGTLYLEPYQPAVRIFARSGSAGRVDLKIYRGNPQDLSGGDGLEVTLTSNGKELKYWAIPTARSLESIDYKIVLKNDSLLLWMGDTSTRMTDYIQPNGVDIQQGYAGIDYSSTDYGSARIIGWATHFDLAYGIVIRDTVPSGVTFLQGSADGQINTGRYAPRQLTGAIGGGGGVNVITWTRIDTLGFGDSLTVTWRGVVGETVQDGRIVNIAYAGLAGYHPDSIGAQSVSRFALDSSGIVEPPPDTPKAGLAVSADPDGGIVTRQMLVTLSSTVSGAEIYYTTNGSTPDLGSLDTRLYDGRVVLDASFSGAVVTLKAIAYAEGYEPSDTITHSYELLRTVPVQSAVFYDGAGDGLAHGVKLALANQGLYEVVVKAHIDLLSFSSVKPDINVDLVRVDGDTLIIPFRSGIYPASNTKLVISEPVLPGSRYTSAHGYLAADTLTVVDGVAPVIVKAVYDAASNGDTVTLVVTFNKPVELEFAGAGDVEIVPFVLFYGQGVRYELRLKYVGHGAGNSEYFLVLGSTRPGDWVRDGDSIRININAVDGRIVNDAGYAQTVERNRAALLEVQWPEAEYKVTMGPNPFAAPGDSLRIWITMAPYSHAAFEALERNAVIRIYDMMGNIVAEAGSNLTMRLDPADERRYMVVWRGTNRRGRLAGTGVYVVQIVLTDQNGKKRAFKNNVYLRVNR